MDCVQMIRAQLKESNADYIFLMLAADFDICKYGVLVVTYG
ncbi:hypothetical protein FBZ89_12419 [Nitrospirillum amazonense]|uniref:Uncharacterized protein n=1 Tax=Nitrospirillum amazonense TaxID=28077 RepID=A0A560ESR2_9PROT|nr:hypothetical protein FBZ89_12419 [Nitrospirillum amazonense]